MQWVLSLDRQGWESGNYRIRRHVKSKSRWIAAWSPWVEGWGLSMNQRQVIGSFSTSDRAKDACARHAVGSPLAPPEIPKQKACRTCRQSKPLAEYHQDLRLPDSHKGECKTCTNKRASRNRATRKTACSMRQIEGRSRAEHC